MSRVQFPPGPPLWCPFYGSTTNGELTHENNKRRTRSLRRRASLRLVSTRNQGKSQQKKVYADSEKNSLRNFSVEISPASYDLLNPAILDLKTFFSSSLSVPIFAQKSPGSKRTRTLPRSKRMVRMLGPALKNQLPQKGTESTKCRLRIPRN